MYAFVIAFSWQNGELLVIWIISSWVHHLWYIYLCWLQKGSCIIIWWNDSGSLYLMFWNDSDTLIWGVFLWYNEMTPGMLISRWKMTPKHQAIRSHSWRMCAFLKPFSGQNEGSFENVKYIPMGSSHVIQYLSSGYKKGSYNLILWKISGNAYLTLKLPHTTQCGLNKGEYMHSLFLFLDKKVNTLTMWNICSWVNHRQYDISLLVTKGELNNNMII